MMNFATGSEMNTCPNGWLTVEQVRGAARFERCKVTGPGGGDGAWVFVVVEGKHGVDAGQQPLGFREVELLGIETMEGGEKLDPKLGGVECVAMGERDLDAGNRLTMVGVVVGRVFHW